MYPEVSIPGPGTYEWSVTIMNEYKKVVCTLNYFPHFKINEVHIKLNIN